MQPDLTLQCLTLGILPSTVSLFPRLIQHESISEKFLPFRKSKSTGREAIQETRKVYVKTDDVFVKTRVIFIILALTYMTLLRFITLVKK